MPLQYESDNIRLGYIKEALSGKPINSEDLVTIEVADDYILYEEEWVDACWEALYQKEDYKGLSQYEAISKFMESRFAQIVAEAGENILEWEFDGDNMYVKISRSGMEKTSAYNDELGYIDPEVPMTNEDIENINTTDAVPTQNAMDMTKIPHPEAFKEVESKGVFFIGGDSVNVDPRGDETPFGIDYPNHFNGWAVGANVGQKLKKKADEGYYYVAVVSYPSNSSMHVNPSFISAMERKLKSLCDYVGVSYTQVMNEAEHYFQEQEAEKQKEELKTKKKTTGQDTLFEEDALVGNKEVKKDLTFYKKVIDLLKKREVEDIKERGGNVRTDAKISIKNVLLEVETEISHKNTEQYKGNIVGVAKFAEVITGKDRVVKHEVYPEEIIFNNWKMLPEPIPVAELFSALKSKVKPEDIQKTFWVMLQTYNLTVPKDHPIAQFLMDFAEEGMTKTSGIEKTAVRDLDIDLIEQFYKQESTRGTVDDKILNSLQVDLILIWKNVARDLQLWVDYIKHPEKHLTPKQIYELKMLDEQGRIMDENDYRQRLILMKYPDWIDWSASFTSDRAQGIVNILEKAKTDKQKILAINEALNQYHFSGNMLAPVDYERLGFDEYESLRQRLAIKKTARRARQDDSLPVLRKLISMGYDKAQWHIHELLHKEVDICDEYNGKIFDLKQMTSNLRYSAPIFEHSHVNCYCYLLCYSTTNPELETAIVDWTGIEEGGRVVDRADAGERKEDFERLFDKYREDLDNIENNSYIHGEFGEPEAGIYSFDLTMYDDTYFNVNELQEIRDKVLELVLDRADRYGITVEDAEIAGNSMIVQTSAMLRNYDFSKEDWVEVEWTYNKRREELINVIMDLSKLQDWLKVTQDSINNLLLEIEQKNANQQMDKFSGLRKTSKLNLNTIRQFFTQERDRGVVDDKILDELQVELIVMFTQIRNILKVHEDHEHEYNVEDYHWVEFRDKLIIKYLPEAEDYSDIAWESLSHMYHWTQAEDVVEVLEKAKTDKEKILAINQALNEGHYSGFMLGEAYNSFRSALGRLKAIQAHHMRFIVAGRVDFLRDQFFKSVEKNIPTLGVTPEQRQMSVESLHEDFDSLVDTDPTKNKQYLQWLVKHYWTAHSKGNRNFRLFMEDLPKIKSYLEAYYKLSLQKKDLGTEEKVTPVFAKDGQPKMNPETGTPMVTKKTLNLSNIDHVENWQKLQDLVKPYLYGKGVELSDTEKEIVNNEANLVYDGQNWQIWVPFTEKSACILGKGTEWCTTYGYEGGRYPNQTQNQFNSYNDDDDLIIIINKQKPEWKYQWHFASGQFMNRDDQQMDIKTFLNRDAQEIKEPLYEYLINRQEKDAFGSYPDPENEEDVMLGTIPDGHVDAIEKKVNNLLQVDAPLDGIMPYIKALPKKDKDQLLGSARLLPKAVESGVVTEKEANKHVNTSELFFKDGKAYWIADDFGSDKILNLFHESSDSDYRTWAENVLGDDVDPSDYYPEGVDINDCTDYFDLISKENIKRIGLHFKKQGVKTGKFDYSVLEDILTNPENYDYPDTDDISDALVKAFSVAKEDANRSATFSGFIKEIERVVGGKYEWLKINGESKLAFPIDVYKFSDGFTMPSSDEGTVILDSVSDIIRQSLRKNSALLKPNGGENYYGDIREDSDISYLNDKISEELDDLGIPEVPVKPIKKVKKALSKILREGIFRKKSMLEKLGLKALGEKVLKLESCNPALVSRIENVLERVNVIRDFSTSTHFLQRLKERTPDSGRGVYNFLKTHNFTINDVSEVSVSDDLRKLEKLLFEIKTPANVTGVEDVIGIAIDSYLRLITFFSKSSTGQRITTPKRYAEV